MPYCRIGGDTEFAIPLAQPDLTYVVIDIETTDPTMGPNPLICCMFATKLDIDINLVYLFWKKWGGETKKKRAWAAMAAGSGLAGDSLHFQFPIVRVINV
jgi:hypothetical protein